MNRPHRLRSGRQTRRRFAPGFGGPALNRVVTLHLPPPSPCALPEYPLGYGSGDAVHAVVAATRWPPEDDMAWRYLGINMRPGAHPPS